MKMFIVLTIGKMLLKCKVGAELWNSPVQFKIIFNWNYILQFKQYWDMQQYLSTCTHKHTKKQISAIQNKAHSKMPLKRLISSKSRAHHITTLTYTLMERLWVPVGTPWFTLEDLNLAPSVVLANILIFWLWPDDMKWRGLDIRWHR